MKRIPPKALLAILGALLYGASPIDLIPDLIPLFGLVDDALVAPMLILVAILQIRARRKQQPMPVRVRR